MHNRIVCFFADKPQIALYFEIKSNVSRALFVTAVETLRVYTRLARNSMAFLGPQNHASTFFIR